MSAVPAAAGEAGTDPADAVFKRTKAITFMLRAGISQHSTFLVFKRSSDNEGVVA